jgi:putative inorganic carbon (hco3(-)) transporter
MRRTLFIIPALTPFYLIKISVFGLPTNVFEIIAVAALLLDFPQWKNIELQKFWRENKLLCWGILFILLGITSSLLYNKTYAVSFGILKSWFLLPIAFSFVLFSNLKNRGDALFVLKSIYYSIFIIALIGLFYKLVHLVTFDNRLQAFYNSPNYLAMFLAPGIFLGLYFLRTQAKNSRWKYFSIASLLIIAFALYLTYSYAAWIAIATSFAIWFFISRIKNYGKYILTAATICIFLFVTQLSSPKFSDLINKDPRSSFASREMIWQSSLKILTDSPFFGIGAGNFQAKYLDYQKYFPLYLEWAVPQPHNIFFAFWLQAGLIGLLGFMTVIFCIFSTLAKLIKKRRDTDLAFALSAVFAYILVHGLVDTTYWKNDLAFLFWIFAFLVIFISSDSKTNAV